MTTTPKAQKEKPHGAAPRLQPRPTAASAARAARNATNRNLLIPQTQRQSPTRPGIGAAIKGKGPTPRNPSKCDSKSDIKLNRNPDIDCVDSTMISSARDEIDTYVVDNLSVVIIGERTSNEKMINHHESAASIEEINETDNFDDKFIEDNPTTNESTGRITDQLPRSRPHTPGVSSRPPTPKSLQSSRPQTPHPLSRPTTPIHPNHGMPASRPNTPYQNANSSPSPPRSPIKDSDDIEAVYSMKQREFHHMKKELDLKQQAVLEIFESLRGLRDRMAQEGLSGSGEGLPPQELVVFNVADWTSDEVAQLCREAAVTVAPPEAADIINTIVPLDERALVEVDAKVATFPNRFADLCLQAFSARQEIIDWVKELVDKTQEDGSETLERIARYNAQGLQLCDALRELKDCAHAAVDTVSQMSRRACKERSTLIAVGESLVREIAHLRQDLELRTAAIDELRHLRSANETARMLEEARQELDEERAARMTTKDKLSTTESQLRQTRMRVSKMDRQLREAEASIASLTGTVKALEDQSRQKEVQLEARARKLKESLKTGEVASSHIAQQRDSLQNEVSDLKDQIENMTSQHLSTIQDLTSQLKDLKHALEDQKLMSQQEMEWRQSVQTTLVQSQNTVEQLRAKIAEIEISRPNPDLPTEREMDLWAELQATKDTLRMAEDEMAACKREKVRFLETMSKITETDNKVAMQKKLAAELLSKEEVMGKMQIQIRELTKNIKLNEQKVVQYEQYVQNLQAHNRAVANCQEAPNGISYQDLQQEIMDLKMSLLEAVHKKEELAELLMQKEQQLEQQNKTSRAQARVIKVREELINMLKNKETEQSRELAALQQDLEHRMNIVGEVRRVYFWLFHFLPYQVLPLKFSLYFDTRHAGVGSFQREVNKQIAAKAEEIQELFATLENKQQQIHRLEKIVLALEEQQRRAQAQRTRHEEKIAALEHELAASGNRKERKYLFF